MSEPLLLSFAEAARLLSISRATLYMLHADGRLGLLVHKIGRRSLLNRAELESWVNHNMPPRCQWEAIWEALHEYRTAY